MTFNLELNAKSEMLPSKKTETNKIPDEPFLLYSSLVKLFSFFL